MLNVIIDHDGTPVVHIPVNGSDRPAKLYVDDYRRLIREGDLMNWHATTSGGYKLYVRTSRALGVARLIMKAKPGQVVRYRDGDTFNLRRDNLMLSQERQKKQPKYVLSDEASAPASSSLRIPR